MRLSKWNGPEIMASVGDEPAVAAGGAIIAAVETAIVDVAGDGGIGAENIEPTAVVPKTWGLGDALAWAGRLRRAASDAGMDPELAEPEAEAVMVAAAAVALGFGARRRRLLGWSWSRS